MSISKRWPTAKPITIEGLKKFAEEPGHKLMYRQSRRWGPTHRWNCAKVRGLDGKWRKIKNVVLVHMTAMQERKNHRYNGWDYAIWFMHIHMMENERDNMGRAMWSCEIRKRLAKPYSYYYLLCRWQQHSIQGVF